MNKKNIDVEMSEEEQDNLESSVKKKEKKKKSREEKTRDRKVVFWVMLFVMAVTLGFWLRAYFDGKINRGVDNVDREMDGVEESVEEDNGVKGFFVKYKI
jgi:hypothetical protein